MNNLPPTILRDIVSKLTFDMPVLSSNYNALDDITTLYFCKTYHSTYCSYIYDGNNKYQIIKIETNNFIQVNGDLTTITNFTIKAPFFWQGTPIQLENVFANIRKYSDKLPMVWLVEPYISYDYDDVLSKLDYSVDITLLFVLPIASEDYCVEEHYTNIIYPIDNLIHEFRLKLRKHRYINDFNGKSKRINRINMGEWVSKGGSRKSMPDNIKRLLDELVTATEYSTSFSVKNTTICCK